MPKPMPGSSLHSRPLLSRSALMLASVVLSSTALSSTAMSQAASAQDSTVVVTIENLQPSRGTLLTPVWLGAHDGSFDLFNTGEAASVPLGGREVEAMAEDGNNAPLSETFARLQPEAPQVVGLAGPSGPLAPGDTASVVLNLDSTTQRYLSYAAMVLPSNDFFVGNPDPLAIELFDSSGAFVGRDVVVTGDQSFDAGTEVNDEDADNVAFLNQAAPDTGVAEGGVVTVAEGFAAPGTFTYPDGVLNHPIVGNGTFATPEDTLLRISFRSLDLNGRVGFSGDVEGAQGNVRAQLLRSERFVFNARLQDLSAAAMDATLTLGEGGPVISELDRARIKSRNSDAFVVGAVGADDIVEGFEGGFDAFVSALVSGEVYLSVETADGSVGAQLTLD